MKIKDTTAEDECEKKEMNDMFFGAYKLDDEIKGGFYNDYEQWFKDTWCPTTEIVGVVDFVVHGSNYAERKNDVRNKAIDYQSLFSDGVSFSWGDLAEFGSYFEEQGKRYGLLGEFRENGIC